MDWIDELVATDERKASAEQRKEELRLHKAKLIRGIAPQFWSEAIERVRADCDKLKAKFPDDRSRHCNFTPMPEGFRLQGSKLPIRICELSLNLDGQCIYWVTYSKESREHSSLPHRESIRLDVNHDDELELNSGGREFHSAESLSKYLISYVCGLGSGY
ncbi:MAG: hypothetical protein WCB14_15990 [Candidatus Acidiferrales bacterium]